MWFSFLRGSSKGKTLSMMTGPGFSHEQLRAQQGSRGAQRLLVATSSEYQRLLLPPPAQTPGFLDQQAGLLSVLPLCKAPAVHSQLLIISSHRTPGRLESQQGGVGSSADSLGPRPFPGLPNWLKTCGTCTQPALLRSDSSVLLWVFVFQKLSPARIKPSTLPPKHDGAATGPGLQAMLCLPVATRGQSAP